MNFDEVDASVRQALDEQKLYYKCRAQDYDANLARIVNAPLSCDSLGGLPSGSLSSGRSSQPKDNDATSQTSQEIDGLANQLAREIDQVLTVFDQVQLGEHVLELASGTGNWTQRIVKRVDRVTAIESSIEMVAAAIAKLGEESNKVRFVVKDIFDAGADCTYDSIVFGFWISHVPKKRMAYFCSMVSKWLKPGGQLFFVDDKAPTEVRSMAQDDSSHIDRYELRQTAQDQNYRIIKNYYTSDELEKLFADQGLVVTVSSTKRFFQYATGSKPNR